MEKLPIEFKENLLTALRSGKYKQGFGKLYDTNYNCFCVWGVGEMVCGNKPEKIKGFHSPKSGFYESKLPEIDHEILRGLMLMNDSGSSFKTLADYIEKEL